MTTEAERLAQELTEPVEGFPEPIPFESNVAFLLRVHAADIERLKDDLSFIERWANHHGQKPHVTAEQALGVIQHYPPIKAITKAYSDGKVPDTYDPYFEIERLKAELGDLPEAQAMLLSDCKRKDTLLREALEALGTRCGTNADERGPSGVITKIRTELGGMP